MIYSFKKLKFICLIAALIWQIEADLQRVAENHAEEEEKKFNIVLGNLSFKSTTPPPTEVSSTLPTKETPEDRVTEESGISLAGSQQRLPKPDSNVTDYDELREHVNKNDASPENSVDRVEAPEEVEGVPGEHFKTESSLNAEEEKEASAEFDPQDKTFGPNPVTSDDDFEVFVNSSCSGDDAKCRTTPNLELRGAISPTPGDKESLSNTSVISSSVSTPLWNILKPVKQDTTQRSSVTFTSFRTEVRPDASSVTTESTATVQTSENLIPVEGSAVNKQDPLHDTPINKTEKSKGTKPTDVSSSSDGRISRTLDKTTPTTPFPTMTKIDVSKGDFTSTSLITKMLEAITTVSTSDPKNSSRDIYSNISAFSVSETNIYPSPKYDPFEKGVITPSSVSLYSDLPTYYSPFSPEFSTPSLINSQSSQPFEDESPFIEDTTVTPHLLPSFRESSLSTKTMKEVMSTTKIATTATAYDTTSSSPRLLVSTLQPQLNSGFVVKGTTSTTTIATEKEEHIPPPRLTNPGCSSLPICIGITLLDTSWEEFCPQAREFQEFLSKAVSHYIHPIHPHQVILEADNCVQNPPVYSMQQSPDVIVALYITDDSGEYAEKLTEICALILRKWAPTTFRNSVLEVRMFSSEIQATTIPVIPELTSGFVAAVSISAVAGVALCMLCILLVVMKQKLLQSRGSETTSPSADAYSLDSLSINASFRRRRNRRSARSYLNHAFSDQDIPSHPLNEKSLLNCLKNRELLEEEFKKIPMNMPKLSDIPEGAHVKNRYSNILPRPETRVILAEPSGDPLKGYINANFVKGYGGKASTYIACQAPLPEGIEDFWRMVWEQQCRVIIMLTMFEENGTSRCATYFPQSTLVSHPPYGDFQVSLLKKDVYEFYTMSTLRLLDLEKNLFRDVVHLWYTNWPDVGVPKDPSSLITFVQQCRSFINCNAGPTVVHCSTGTGRTGVFIALDICMREFDESRSIDILQCISQLRRDRGGAVQNKDQYTLIHEAMLEYISRMANQSQRSSVQS